MLKCLRDCRLASPDDGPLYWPGMPVPIQPVRTAYFHGDVIVDDDRRFVTVMAPTGLRYLIRHDPDGFSWIALYQRDVL